MKKTKNILKKVLIITLGSIFMIMALPFWYIGFFYKLFKMSFLSGVSFFLRFDEEIDKL